MLFYVTYYPCLDCAKLIIQTGIKKLIITSLYVNPKYKEMSRRVYKILGIAGIKTFCYDSHSDELWEITSPLGVFHDKMGPETFLMEK